MNIPFVLKFLNVIELFQVIKKLDKQFERQVCRLKKSSRVIPLWEVEKKILFWTYENHKYLGSPLMVRSLETKKSFMMRNLEYENSPYKEAREKLVKIKANELENQFDILIQEILKDFSDYDRNEYCEAAKEAATKLVDIGISIEEAHNINIRKVFGNLVSRGYAKFYPEVQKEWSHWEKIDENVKRDVYDKVAVTQYNCDGIIITKEGLLVGEALNSLCSVERIDKKSDDIIKIYQEKTGAEQYLRRKRRKWLGYDCIIGVGYLAFFLIICKIISVFVEGVSYVFDKMPGVISFVVDLIKTLFTL